MISNEDGEEAAELINDHMADGGIRTRVKAPDRGYFQQGRRTTEWS